MSGTSGVSRAIAEIVERERRRGGMLELLALAMAELANEQPNWRRVSRVLRQASWAAEDAAEGDDSDPAARPLASRMVETMRAAAPPAEIPDDNNTLDELADTPYRCPVKEE